MLVSRNWINDTWRFCFDASPIVSCQFSGTYAPHILLRYHNLAVLCAADVKVSSSEGDTISETWGELLTEVGFVYCTKNTFNWATMSPLMQTQKDLCFWYYRILLEHINYYIYKSLMKLSLDASHFGKVIRRENQVLMELQSTREVKTDGDKYSYKVASVKSQGVQFYCL